MEKVIQYMREKIPNLFNCWAKFYLELKKYDHKVLSQK